MTWTDICAKVNMKVIIKPFKTLQQLALPLKAGKTLRIQIIIHWERTKMKPKKP